MQGELGPFLSIQTGEWAAITITPQEDGRFGVEYANEHGSLTTYRSQTRAQVVTIVLRNLAVSEHGQSLQAP